MNSRWLIIRQIERAARRYGRMTASQLREIEAQKRLIRTEAQGIETEGQDRNGLGAEHESPVPTGCAQPPSGESA